MVVKYASLQSMLVGYCPLGFGKDSVYLLIVFRVFHARALAVSSHLYLAEVRVLAIE